jgi:hypothetical protein
MKMILISLCLVATGCEAPYRPTPVRVDVPWPAKHKAVLVNDALPTPPVPPPASPVDAVKDGADAKNDAKDFVLGERAQTDEINRLTVLSRAVDAAKTRMDQGFIANGRYSRQDVDQLRHAVNQLRFYLRSKGL